MCVRYKELDRKGGARRHGSKSSKLIAHHQTHPVLETGESGVVHVVNRKLECGELESVEATCVGGKDCDTAGVTLDPPAGHIQPLLPHYQGLAGLGCFFPLFFPFFPPFLPSLPPSRHPHPSLHTCCAPAPCPGYILLMVTMVSGQGLRPQGGQGCSAPESICPLVS